MRRCLLAAISLSFLLACSPTPVAEQPTQVSPTARPTPSGPTPTLPLARAIASPSAVTAQQTIVVPTFALQSTAFNDGGTLPSDFTCDGQGESPPLAWSGAPPGTAAYALITQDTDAANQPLTEWLLYNIPMTVQQLPAGVPPRPLLTNGIQQGTNDNNSVGYLAACPDHGQPPHHVAFQLFAQDGYVTLETGASYDAVHDALTGHTLGHTQLTAIVQR